MSETKATRLGKAAKELGVSTGTITDFLSKKGVKLEDSPMAKLEGEAYEMILAEFAKDKAEYEKSHAAAAKVRESRSTITLEEAKKNKEFDKVEEEPEIDYSKFKRKVEVKEKPAPPAPEPPKPVAPIVVESPAIEEEISEIPAKKIARKKSEEPAQEVIEDKPNEVRVVGKIDLDALDSPKTKGRKKKEEEDAAIAEEAKKTAKNKKKVEETPAPEQIAPVIPVAVVPDAPVEKELIRVNVAKLAGPKVMGKIVLPTEADKKKPDQNKGNESA
ncbi:MAG: hypothetical protein ACKVOK_06265, partial [Flavobacteriales bacterium]